MQGRLKWSSVRACVRMRKRDGARAVQQALSALMPHLELKTKLP